MPVDLFANPPKRKREPRDLLEGPQEAISAAWSAASEADQIEEWRGTGAFSDMTGSAMAKAIPFADEIVSGLNAPFRAAREWWEGEGFDIGRAYDRNMQVEEELQRRRQERSPVLATVGAIAGGIGAAGPLVKGGATLLQGAQATLPSLVGRGAAEGALYGAAYGAGEGQGLEERASNALMGAVAGGATGGLTGGLARIGAAKQPAMPSLDELRAAKNAAYDAADALGIQYTPDAYKNLVRDVIKDAQGKKLNPARHPKAASIIQDMAAEAQAGTAPTLRQLDELRQIIYRDIGGDGAEQFFGNRILAKIDDFIDNAQVGDALTGDPRLAKDIIAEARELNRRYRNAQRVEESLVKAERRAASTNSGANLENAIRQNLRRILDNKSTSRFLNDAEKEALETVVRGTTGQNTARAVGNWAKGFGGHSLAGGSVVAAALTGNPLPLLAAGVPYALGSGLKAVSRRMGNTNEQVAEALIRTGAVPNAQLEPLRRAIIDALTRSSAQQLPGYIAQ